MPHSHYPLTADGEVVFKFTLEGQTSAKLYVYGDFGGGTLTFGYVPEHGGFQEFVSDASPITGPEELKIEVAHGISLAVNLEGSTSPNIMILVSMNSLE